MSIFSFVQVTNALVYFRIRLNSSFYQFGLSLLFFVFIPIFTAIAGSDSDYNTIYIQKIKNSELSIEFLKQSDLNNPEKIGFVKYDLDNQLDNKYGDTFWVIVKLIPQEGVSSKLIDFENRLIDYVDIYMPDGRVINTGSLRPYGTRILDLPGFSVPVDMTDGREKIVIFRISGVLYPLINIYIHDNLDEILNILTTKNVYRVLLFAVSIFVMIGIGFTYSLSRNKYYFLITAVIIVSFFLHTVQNDILFKYFVPNSPIINRALLFASYLIVNISVIAIPVYILKDRYNLSKKLAYGLFALLYILLAVTTITYTPLFYFINLLYLSVTIIGWKRLPRTIIAALIAYNISLFIHATPSRFVSFFYRYYFNIMDTATLFYYFSILLAVFGAIFSYKDLMKEKLLFEDQIYHYKRVLKKYPQTSTITCFKRENPYNGIMIPKYII